ncbi:lysosomal-associated transmembrane protein 4B isoform X1 [Rhinatrema bivittatum]|uniref:lysosomal-associated transmembrane protein 4B isoform X1 n=1 Tax=Rhinatrema bivittatum TaxID=194408 RepID=UPI001125EAEA|nr:lysosomal-associated transmembrane protein 4B isoform X1 [Rhinatrema bivittatum]
MKMNAPWARFYSNSCCLCCHVRTGTIILGVWYLIINGVVLLILLSALSDSDQYHLPSTELGSDFDFMDDAKNVGHWMEGKIPHRIQSADSQGHSALGWISSEADMCIATAVSLLMILICGMATYGAYKEHAAWIVPFFCYQIFDFALNTLVSISVLVYPNTIQDYLRQLPANFPYKEEITSMNPTCLVVIILIFISIILAFKGQWNTMPADLRLETELKKFKKGVKTWLFKQAFMDSLQTNH